MTSAVWYSWDNHRRAREVSKELDVTFEVIERSRLPLVGHLVNILSTVRALQRRAGGTIIVRNPSLLLGVVACLMKSRKGFRVVQDLHLCLTMVTGNARGLRAKIYRRLLLYSIRTADLNIVSNPGLKTAIEAEGGRAMVLQDPIPAFSGRVEPPVSGERRVVYVCNYSEDEPVAEVFKAGRDLAKETNIYVTGRIPPGMRTWTVPPGVKLTDFLSDPDYLSLLESADAVMSLSTRPHTLLCGAYEGLAFRKPLILSDTPVLRSSFGEHMLYVKNNAGAIAEGIRKLYSAKPFFDRHAADLASAMAREWKEPLEEVRSFVLDAPEKDRVPA